jgi:ABC transporter substrate binding protein
MMRRREFITLLGGATAAWPVAARAQPTGKLPIIGFLGTNTASAQRQWTDAFLQRLRELGWIEGRTVAIEYRWADVTMTSTLRRTSSATISADLSKRPLYVVSDPLVATNRNRLGILAVGAQLPTMHGSRELVEAGGLVSYGANFPALFRRGAEYVDKVLRGAKPADLPVEQPTKFDLVISLITAKALGLTIPPLLLARADEVIE